MTNEAFQNKLQQLCQEYVKRLPDDIHRLKDFLAEIEADSSAEDPRQGLKQLAHKLSGTGGSFGFPSISEAGRDLEEALLDDLQFPVAPLTKKTQILIDACLAATEEKIDSENSFFTESEENNNLPLLLIVDDDQSMRQLLTALFGEYARIMQAESAQQAHNIILEHEPDLVLLDDKLNGSMSGSQLLNVLSSSGRLQDIPVIMLTSNASPDNVMQVLMEGASDYIIKPFSPTELVLKVRERLLQLNYHILVVDDDEAVCKMLQHKFQSVGCKVSCRTNGEEAWELLLQQKFSLVLLDRMMPGYDGFSLLQMMQNADGMKDTPVVFLTARHYGADVLEGLHGGAADYITKPFNPDEVVARCLRLIKVTDSNKQTAL